MAHVERDPRRRGWEGRVYDTHWSLKFEGSGSEAGLEDETVAKTKRTELGELDRHGQ